MPLSLPVSLFTLVPGTPFVSASYTVDPADVSVKFIIDRTCANGFNSQPATTIAQFNVEWSMDNGATWTLLGGGTVGGGVIHYLDRQGVDHIGTESSINCGLEQAQGGIIHANINVVGASVGVQGSVTVI